MTLASTKLEGIGWRLSPLEESDGILESEGLHPSDCGRNTHAATTPAKAGLPINDRRRTNKLIQCARLEVEMGVRPA